MDKRTVESLIDASGHDRTLMGKSLMYVFAVAGAVTMFPLALWSDTSMVDQTRLVITAGCCWSLALLLLVAHERVPMWAYQLFLACGTLLIQWAMYAAGDSTSAYAMLFFPVAIYAFYFFTRAQAVLQMMLIALAYTGVLLLSHDLSSTPVIHWAITTATLVFSGALIGAQRDHVDSLVARLCNAAHTDALTGLRNRRGFEQRFRVELERARRHGLPLTLIVGDLDAFKDINDRYGHQAGDRVLERLSRIMRDSKRLSDTAARVGGEEFALLAQGSDSRGAYLLAERMRREVRDAFDGEPYDLTISFGLASFPEHAADADDLVHCADQALYAAKELGRDRSVIYGAEIADRTAELNDPDRSRQGSTVLELVEVLDIRDAGTVAHSQTVGAYAEALARELALTPDRVERVRFGGIVHDVGKIGISDSILRKPGLLDDDDWHEMRRHPEIGARILAGASLDDISGWVLAHHERPDGLGYPYGLSAAEIPFEALILAVADAYEAMTSDRPYREALSQEEARAELVRGAGSQFDANVVEAFLRMLDRDRPADAEPALDAAEPAPETALAR